jgi:hypothetical protein
MILLRIPSQRVLIIGGLVFAVISFVSLFAYRSSALPIRISASTTPNTSGTVYLSPELSAAASSTRGEPMREIHIANNGLVLLRGARVVSISANQIRVALIWDSEVSTWILNTAYNTQFFGSEGQKETSNDIQTGDIVTATGMLAGSGSSLAMDAGFVRE